MPAYVICEVVSLVSEGRYPNSAQTRTPHVPKKGLLIGYVEILGALRVGGILAEIAPPSSLEYIYVDDIFGLCRDRTDEFIIDGEKFDATDWRSIGLTVGAATTELKDYALGAMKPLVDR